MIKRLCVAVAVVTAVGMIGTALAPAHNQRHKVIVQSGFQDNGMGGGSFPVNLESHFQYCESGRVVKFFKDGVQIDKHTTDRYGMTSFGGVTVDPGTYQVKVGRKRLPRALQHRPGKRHKRICRPGASPLMPVP